MAWSEWVYKSVPRPRSFLQHRWMFVLCGQCGRLRCREYHEIFSFAGFGSTAIQLCRRIWRMEECFRSSFYACRQEDAMCPHCGPSLTSTLATTFVMEFPSPRRELPITHPPKVRTYLCTPQSGHRGRTKHVGDACGENTCAHANCSSSFTRPGEHLSVAKFVFLWAWCMTDKYAWQLSEHVFRVPASVQQARSFID